MMLHPVLANIHSHPRDKEISFYEETHTYTIATDLESTYTSVTTFIHSHFPHFNADEVIDNMMKGKNWKEGHKYWGMTKEQINELWNKNRDEVSSSGTTMHFNIECFMNNPNIEKGYDHKDLLNYYNENIPLENISPLEWQYFIQYVQQTKHLKPYRTEWTIFDEDLKLSGSIDMVYENPDGTLMIYDWKRAKDIVRINNFNRYATTYCISHLPDSNFWHYALQLNIYKGILERKYGKKVTELCLVRLHPEAEEQTFELIHLPILTTEVNDLFNERLESLLKKG